MKVLIFFFCVIFVGVADVASDEILSESLSRKGRIASGSAGKKGENLEFCYLSIGFFQKHQTCGCVIMNEEWVMTSARCAYEYEKNKINYDKK
jgi:secreted trypsin-like serine protease